MLTLYTLEKKLPAKLAVKETERSPPPQSELEWSTLNQDPRFPAEFAPWSHLSHFTPWFSFFQVPNKKASTQLRRRLRNGKWSSAFIKSHSKIPSLTRILLLSPRHQVSPCRITGVQGNSSVKLPGYSYTWNCHFPHVPLQCPGAVLPPHSDSLFLCTKPKPTILLGPAKDPCVLRSTWGSLASSPKLAALRT